MATASAQKRWRSLQCDFVAGWERGLWVQLQARAPHAHHIFLHVSNVSIDDLDATLPTMIDIQVGLRVTASLRRRHAADVDRCRTADRVRRYAVLLLVDVRRANRFCLTATSF